MKLDTYKWWQKATFYQIYPRSFADGNGDGIGDFSGMIAKLDYLKDLGVDAVWLSPHYPSPMADCGYDISDYEAIAPEYGTMEDFKRFLDGLHTRGMRLVLDLVLNHTSDQHQWFVESRSSKDNPKRDWYVWKKGKMGQPPNDWHSTFGGSGWELDDKTGEYYYHFFFKEQPDLNWRNPEVKKAMFDMVRFWLDMGVDGFRLDAIGTVYEDPDWKDHHAPFNLDDLFQFGRKAKTDADHKEVGKRWDILFEGQHDLPEVHDLMKELRQVMNEYEDRVLIGETDDLAFYGNGEDELHLVFNFPLMHSPRITAEAVRGNQKERLGKMPAKAWPCNTLGNHDSSRMHSRFGDGKNDDAMARQNLLTMLTLRGTPVLYNGEEIGMRDYLITDPTAFRDPLSTRAYKLEMKFFGTPDEQAILVGAREGRDKGRTPMQWANEPNAGFCPENVSPWLPVDPAFICGVNVEEQAGKRGSLLEFYRAALKMRHANPALITGAYRELKAQSPDALVFERKSAEQTLIVAMNTSASEVVEAPGAKSLRVVFSTHRKAGELVDAGRLALKPFETTIFEE